MLRKYLTIAVSVAFYGALAACTAPAPAPSHPRDVSSLGSVDQRQREIDNRIEQGFRSGRLTAGDHRALRAKSDEIRRDERRMMADGELSLNERNALHARLEGLSREIDLQMNDPNRGATR